MKKRQCAVIGLGKFGFKVAQTLSQEGASVLAIDKDETKIEKARDIVTEALQLDSTDEKALEASGIKNVDVVVVGMGDSVDASVLTVSLLKKIEIEEIIARANSESHARILRAMGVKKVIMPEEDMGMRIGRSILTAPVREHIELGDQYSLVEIEVKEGSKLIGETLKQLDVRAKYRIVILLIKRVAKRASEEKEEEMIVTREFPTAAYEIKAKDILVVIGEEKSIKSFEKICTKGVKED